VLVVGAGPAGLAAAARLVERGGEKLDVRLVTAGHHLGGKAASWRDDAGRLIDHGQHAVFGFYDSMRELLAWAGVDSRAHLVSNEGVTAVYEARDQKLHELKATRNALRTIINCFGYTGLTWRELANITTFSALNFATFAGVTPIDHLDDVCFTAWCLENGMAPSIVKTGIFHISRVGQMNFPGEISAYSLLKAFRCLSRDARRMDTSLPDGGMTEIFWEPIARRFLEKGGTFETLRKLVGLRLDGNRVSAVVFAEPDSRGHDKPAAPGWEKGHSPFEGKVPVKADTEILDPDFDDVICTLPAAAFHELNPGDDRFWSIPDFEKARHIRSVRPLSMQIWHRERVTRKHHIVLGFDAPFAAIIDNKRILREYREDPRFGSVVYFAGQETGFEEKSADELLEIGLAALARIPGFEKLDREGVLHWEVIRHHASHSLYFYSEPGIQKFRPRSETPLSNFFLAGDWVRNDADFPCMEAAIRSGNEAAERVLARA
jgi:uncharacterized protein with NAD-binding domain and iron-sulfur cluster